MNLLRIEKQKSNDEKWISLKLEDPEENEIFWIDCSLMDGYGNIKNFKTEDLFIDWSFNKYIFYLEYEEDVKAKLYQENAKNIEKITDFIDEKNDYLVNILKEM